MRIEQTRWSQAVGWDPHPPGRLGEAADLTLIFAARGVLEDSELRDELTRVYPNSHYLGCWTAGEICGTEVTDDTLVATAIAFETTRVSGAKLDIRDVEDSYRAGESLAGALEHDGLVHVLILSDGLDVNGSDLVRGLADNLPENVTITGALSADGEDFKQTLVLWDGEPSRYQIAAVGLYGPDLQVGYASLGGWDPFGPERRVTRSKGNVLYELDGRSALELYKKYLGDHAAELPASGLRFPLAIGSQQDKNKVVRTILSVSESDQSMTFAGDVPEGAIAQLMKANFDRLIDGAGSAARASHKVGTGQPELAILVSCVGRKLVLKQRIEEEVEGVREVLGDRTTLAGFYSYGEISPFCSGAKCELHNQTMTITTLSETVA